MQESNTLLYEINTVPKYFKRYGRGRIVKVCFGVNIGSEFSGDHFAIVAGIYTAIVSLIPGLNNTSFHDIAVSFEVWILFGIIIIMNSKSAVDSTLKCFFVFLDKSATCIFNSSAV